MSSEHDEEQQHEQSLMFSISAHPITGQPMVGLNLKDADGGSVSIKMSADEAIHTAAKLQAIGSFVFGQEMALVAAQQSQRPQVVQP